MKHASRIVRAAAVALLAAGLLPATAQAQGAPPQGTPLAKILLVDRNEVFQRSNAGQNIIKQVQALTLSAQNALKARAMALRTEYGQLQQQAAILSPAAKAAKIKAFDVKQQALQADVQKQEGLIQGGFLAARQQFANAMKPVLQKIMAERGANFVIERNAVVLSLPGTDVTDLTVARMNQALPQVKVTLRPLPPGAGGPPGQ